MTENTRTIALTQGKVALVDAADYEWLNQWKWCFKQGRAERHAPSDNGYRRSLLMHRVILGDIDGMCVDHINHDPLDNRRANLRLCTKAENSRNRSRQRNSSSQYLGVGWHKANRKWIAEIRINGKSGYLGSFDNEIDAAKAYDKAARELHGEFANPNFP